METKNIELGTELGQMIADKLKENLSQRIDETIEIFHKEKGQIIAGLVIDVMRMADMQVFEDKVVFTIRDEYKKD